MQSKNHKPVKKILLDLANYLKVQGVQGVAEYFGENKTRLYAWIKNGNIPDTGIILAKHPEINPSWLKTGEGPMLRYQPPPGDQINFSHKSTKSKVDQPSPPDQGEFFNMRDMVNMTMEVLESETVYKSALASNIRAFHKAVNMEKEMNQLSEDVSEIKKQNKILIDELRQVMDVLKAAGLSVPEKREQNQG